MKIKVKNEIDKIKLTVSHREAVLIASALHSLFEDYVVLKDEEKVDFILELNRLLFDRDEIIQTNDLAKLLSTMSADLVSILSTIHPY